MNDNFVFRDSMPPPLLRSRRTGRRTTRAPRGYRRQINPARSAEDCAYASANRLPSAIARRRRRKLIRIKNKNTRTKTRYKQRVLLYVPAYEPVALYTLQYITLWRRQYPELTARLFLSSKRGLPRNNRVDTSVLPVANLLPEFVRFSRCRVCNMNSPRRFSAR